jgi:hypothetical protein
MSEEVILEPGDPGYVEPRDTPSAPMPDPPPPGEQPNLLTAPDVPPDDLTHQQQPGESDAEFRARTTGVVVDSQNPTDIVPNTAQTTMGVRVQVEGTDPPLYVGVPPESIEEEPPPEIVVEDTQSEEKEAEEKTL